jgi:hypothetical protein
VSKEKQEPQTEPDLLERGAGLDIAVGLVQGLGTGIGAVGAQALHDRLTAPPADPPPPSNKIILPSRVENE